MPGKGTGKGYSLIKRQLRGKNIFYYRMNSKRGEKQKPMYSTGQTNRYDADKWVQNNVIGRTEEGKKTLRQFLDKAYTEEGAHVKRYRDNKRNMSERYIKDQRRRIELYIFKDEIADMTVGDIRVHHVEDFKARLQAKGTGARTVNIVIQILKTMFNEAINLELLGRNPARGVMATNYEEREVGTFTGKELEALFRECPGSFDDRVTYTCFLTTATCGLRRGEALGLSWRQIDFDNGIIHVDQSIHPSGNVGLPKWGKKRNTFLPAKTTEALKALRAESAHVLPDAFVFCYPDGTARLGTWWKKAFDRAMIGAGFFPVDRDQDGNITKVYNPRGLKPHSLRHSLQTLLADAGQDQGKSRAAFGWASTAVQAGYTHADTFDLSPLKTAVDDIFTHKE